MMGTSAFKARWTGSHTPESRENNVKLSCDKEHVVQWSITKYRAFCVSRSRNRRVLVWNVLKLCWIMAWPFYTWQLIMRLGELSALGATEKTGLWRQSSMCSDTLASRRRCRTSGLMFCFWRQGVAAFFSKSHNWLIWTPMCFSCFSFMNKFLTVKKTFLFNTNLKWFFLVDTFSNTGQISVYERIEERVCVPDISCGWDLLLAYFCF